MRQFIEPLFYRSAETLVALLSVPYYLCPEEFVGREAGGNHSDLLICGHL